MLLRKLTAAFLPALMCLVLLWIYRWLDGLMNAEHFLSLMLKGLLLGILLALALPAAGLRSYSNGLTPWMYGGAGFFALLLLLQGLRFAGVMNIRIPLLLLDGNPMVTLVEAAVMSFTALTAFLNRKRDLSPKKEKTAA
ncbi:MAG: hypothetical protein E7331_06400 [Clostridiales bacterium]|nr:hypothetical protein [Clostridiales bacterium]